MAEVSEYFRILGNERLRYVGYFLVKFKKVQLGTGADK